MKKIIYIFFVFFFCLSFTACNSCSRQNDLSWLYDTGDENYQNEESEKYVTNNEPEKRGSAAMRDPVKKEIRQGVTLAEAGREIYTDLLDLESLYNLGGIKLCAEMSADREGKWQSSFWQSTSITFLPPEELNLKKIVTENSPFYIVSEIINADISVEIGTVKLQFYGFNSFFIVSVNVSNLRDYPVGVHVPCGQMLEVQAPNVQNILVVQQTETMLAPRQRGTLQLKALCAAEKRQDPSGNKAKLTPFIFDAPSNIFYSQQNIWDYMRREPRENRKWEPFTKTIRLSNGKQLYIEEKDNGIGPYSNDSWISGVNTAWTKFRRMLLNATDFPVGFQKCASQHDIDYGTLGVSKTEADNRLKECAESLFPGTVGDFCKIQNIGLEQLCAAYGWKSVRAETSFADFVLATMAGGEESWKDGQEMARLTEEYRDEIERALGMSIDADRYYFVLKN